MAHYPAVALGDEITAGGDAARLVAHLSDPAILVDDGGVVLAVNEAMLDLSGGEGGRLVGETIEDLDGAALRGCVGSPISIGLPGFGLLAGVVPFPVGEGHWALIARDLPRVEQARREWLRLADATPIAMIEVDDAGDITWMNPNAASLLGYEQSELVGKRVELLIPDERREAHREHRAGYRLRPVARPMGETRVLEALHASGERLPVEVFLGRARGEGGQARTVAVLVPLARGTRGDTAPETAIALNHDLLRQREQLQAKENQLRAIHEHLPAGIAEVDADGRLRFVNPRFAEMVGRQAAELPGQKLLEVFSRANQRSLRPLLGGVLLGGGEVERELRLVLGQRHRHYLVHFVPMARDDSLGRVGAVTLWIDTTERHHAEAAMRESRARFQLALDAGEMGVFSRDQGADTLSLDPRARRILGTSAELRAMAPLGEIHPRDAQRVAETLATFHRGGSPRAAWTHRVAGEDLMTWREVEFREMKLPDEPDRGVRTLGVCWDVTEQKAREARRRDLETIIESSFDFIAIAGLDGYITYRNAAFERFLGSAAQDLSNLQSLFGDEAHGREIVRAVLEDGAWYGESEVAGRAGQERPVSQLVMLRRDALGQPSHLSMVMRDLRDIRSREEALRRSNAELEQFAYVASHDLKEPLRMISQFSRMLGETLEPRLEGDEAVQFRFLREGAERMQGLVQGLLDFGRIGREFSPEDVSLADVIGGVLDDLRVPIAESKALVEVHPLPHVHGVANLLHQLFLNLVANALKFCRECPRIVIREDPSAPDQVCVVVQDNGIGIDPRHHERIFQIFQRLHARESFPGTGMGLAIARKVVGEHGGHISVESALGSGTAFRITLPRHEPPPRRPSTKAPRPT